MGVYVLGVKDTPYGVYHRGMNYRQIQMSIVRKLV